MCGPCVALVWPLCGHCVANAWPIRELAKQNKNMLSQARAMRTCSGRQTCDCCLHGPHTIGLRPPVSHRVIPPIPEGILCNFCESSGDEDEQESRATCCSTDHLAKSELTAPSAQRQLHFFYNRVSEDTQWWHQWLRFCRKRDSPRTARQKTCLSIRAGDV